MNVDVPALMLWLNARAKEPSTMRGLVGLLMTLGIGVDPTQLTTILTMGITVISLINVFKKDAGSVDAKPRR